LGTLSVSAGVRRRVPPPRVTAAVPRALLPVPEAASPSSVPPLLTVKVPVMVLAAAPAAVLVRRTVPPETVRVRFELTVRGAEIVSVPELVKGEAPTLRTASPLLFCRVRALPPLLERV